jgi:hypothetical protein
MSYIVLFFQIYHQSFRLHLWTTSKTQASAYWKSSSKRKASSVLQIAPIGSSSVIMYDISRFHPFIDSLGHQLYYNSHRHQGSRFLWIIVNQIDAMQWAKDWETLSASQGHGSSMRFYQETYLLLSENSDLNKLSSEDRAREFKTTHKDSFQHHQRAFRGKNQASNRLLEMYRHVSLLVYRPLFSSESPLMFSCSPVRCCGPDRPGLECQ